MPRRTFKYRLYPNYQQQEKLQATLDVCRELYNAGLQERRDAWSTARKSIGYVAQAINSDQSNPSERILRLFTAKCYRILCAVSIRRSKRSSFDANVDRGLDFLASTERQVASVA